MEPGCKYDSMLILSGRQGLGKPLFLDKMSRDWFNDTIRTFVGKEASELLQEVWFVEIGELDAFRRTDVARIKQFLVNVLTGSERLTVDMCKTYRAAVYFLVRQTQKNF